MQKSVDPETALALVLEHSRELAPREVPLADALGLVLDEEVRADRAYPPFDRAAMDGFAVRVADAGHAVRVMGEVAAGRSWPHALELGQAVEIMAGAPTPDGTEAVVPKEDAQRDGERVLLPPAIQGGRHIAAAGSECRPGAVVLAAGAVVTPLAVAVLASFGRARVRVVPAPSVAVLVTGDEIVPVEATPGPAQIRDSNGPMLAAMARETGLRVVSVEHVRDERDALRTALARAEADLVLLTGGVSAGKYDFVPSLLADLGAEIVFQKVAQKPGKPLLFARRGAESAAGGGLEGDPRRSARPAAGHGPQLVFGLPGNPLSAHLGFARYVLPAALRLCRRPAPRAATGRLARPLEVAGQRVTFVLARVARTLGVEGSGAGFTVEPLVGRGSADIFAAATANAYLRFAPGTHHLAAGDEIEFTWAGAPG